MKTNKSCPVYVPDDEEEEDDKGKDKERKGEGEAQGQGQGRGTVKKEEPPEPKGVVLKGTSIRIYKVGFFFFFVSLLFGT
jgi:hypothetical protein